MNSTSTQPEPEPKKDGNDVKWYDRRLMIPSLIIAPLLFVLFYTLAMRHKPPEGFVFEREPVLSGTYKCCEAGGAIARVGWGMCKLIAEVLDILRLVRIATTADSKSNLTATLLK